MTFTSSTPPRRSNKLRPATGWLGGLLLLALLLGACSKDVTGIGVGLPDANAATGAYLIDTLTVRTSTVLRDSVVTSTSSDLLVGRYTDPQLGAIQAKSYFRVGLSASFVPDGTYVADSLVLTLLPTSGASGTNAAYRYGDTTKVQTLVSVYEMYTPVPNTKVSFASAKLSPLGGYNPVALNRRTPVRRASPILGTLRVRLADSLGQRLMRLGQRGLIQNSDQLQVYLPGLAISSASTDDAALIAFSAASTTTALVLYYHDPANATTALSSSFTVPDGGAHCYQVDADRSKGALGNVLPTKSLTQKVSASLTGEQTVIEGALGLQTKVEFPYLSTLTQLGQHLTLTSAQLTAEVPPSTVTATTPVIATIQPYVSNALNQPTSIYNAGASSNSTAVSYAVGTSSITTLDQGAYSFSVLSYIQAVLAGTTPNNGLLLASAAPARPSRVLLASQRGQLSKLRLRVYVISTN